MSQIAIFDELVLICPECKKINKMKCFKEIQDLNIHLKMKHDAPYKISINGKLKGSASPVLRLEMQ